MSEFRFRLDPRSGHRKYICPQCGRKSLTLYVDMSNLENLGDDIGRCDHERSCCYHNPPPEDITKLRKSKPYSCTDNAYRTKVSTYFESTPSTIDRAIMEKSLSRYDLNPLFRWMSTIVGKDEAERLFRLYNVGTSHKWGGAAIFWQVDVKEAVRTGKVMGYDDKTGKRIKVPANQVSWAHTELKLSGFHLRQCLFGEHLLMCNPNRKVAIVESEKTAIIAASFIPDFVWLATGGKNGCLNRQSMSVLSGRDVILIPDLQCEDDWQQRADRMLSDIARSYSISDTISARATEEQRSQGLDIADFLLMQPTPQMVLQSMMDRNPILKKFIEDFDCTLVEE